MTNPYKQYQRTQVVTASREKILLMLYEGAIRFTKQARIAMNEKKVADKGKAISKATAIISELMATLDFKIGGQLAQDLENLYIFMIDKLIEANVHNKVECLDDVEKLLNTLYTAWKDVVENPRADGVPSPTLQPEEFKKFQEQVAANGGEMPESKRSNEKDQPRGNLKVVA